MSRLHQCLAVSALITCLIFPTVLRADCPDGTRTPTEAERQEYMRTVSALKAALPPAPAGWELQTPRFGYPVAVPTHACKGLKLTPEPYEVVYVSLEQQALNAQDSRARDARIAALRKLSPEEQKQADDFTRQGMQLSAQSAAARKSNNLAEATRLREQALQSYAKSRAVYQAHTDRTTPLIRAIDAEPGSASSPTVRVRLAVDELRGTSDSGEESMQIPGVPHAFFDRQKALVLSFGRDGSGRNIGVRLEGARERALTIARLFANSRLRALAAK